MKKVILVFSLVLFHCKDKNSTKILMKTEIVTITIELLPNQAPITVKNFLQYIDVDRYSDFTFYRIVKKIKIQIV